MISKTKKGYVVLSKSGRKQAAKKRLKQVEYYKRKKK